MDKEAVVHTYSGILLSHEKECIWVSSKEVDEPRVHYTEWSKSEREKQISYTNAYTWNLERWCWWNYLQGSNGDTDIENKFMDTGAGLGRKETVGCMERVNTETYTTLCKIDSQWEFAVWLRELKQGLCNNLQGWDGEGDGREFQEGRDISIPMADSCWYLSETNKIP